LAQALAAANPKPPDRCLSKRKNPAPQQTAKADSGRFGAKIGVALLSDASEVVLGDGSALLVGLNWLDAPL
jgi:hypothetical protein